MKKVEVNTRGIKNRLKKVKPYHAIAEYIWNGFDAGANTINITYEANELGNIKEFSIEDNGTGIPFNQLGNKFKPVLSSEKQESELQYTLVHGKNGIGRLTFYHFSQNAKWQTCYTLNEGFFEYSICANEDNLDTYTASKEIESTNTHTGTKVTFYNVFDISEHYITEILIGYLKKEFSWFLELKKDSNYSILINGLALSYSDLVKDKEKLEIEADKEVFEISYVRWSCKLNRHFSRYYCIDSNDRLKYSMPTTLNNKGDEFYHSIFIKDGYFDSFKPSRNDGQDDLYSNTDKTEEFKKLILNINNYLKDKRKPFIVDYAKNLVEEYEKNGIFPEFDAKNKWEVMKSEDVKETVRQLYQVDPRIFSNLSLTQKKTLVGFVSLIIDGGEVDDLFKVLDGIIELSSSERELFSRQLETTKMSSIVRTIELISDRYKSVEEFKKLVFDPSMYAGEVPHLQKMMEKNYWLIGEEYQLVTAAEPKFEEALRRYTYILCGDSEKKEISHADKNREMDLFLVRQGKRNKKIENIVIELKHPINVRLGKKEIDQVYSYYQVIKSDSRFNGSNSEWKFYLIGNDFDSSGYIKAQIDSLKMHGEPGLAFRGEYKVYVFTWSEIFTEFQLKHDFLNEKLNLELERLSLDEHDSADDIVGRTRTSDAPVELKVINA